MRRVISSSIDEASPPSSTDEASPPSSSLARARPLEKGSGETAIPKLFWLAKILLAR